MVEMVRLPARSNNGCWTCRLRRKKCDEIRPFCSPCISLVLECHGYGPRPHWMDNGILQRDRAARFKRLVSQGISKKGRQHQIPTSQLPLASPDGLRSLSTNISGSTVDPSLVTVNRYSSQHPRDELQHQDRGGIGFGSLSMADYTSSPGPPSPSSLEHQLCTSSQDEFRFQDGVWDHSLLSLTENVPSTSSGPSDPVNQHLGTFTHLDQVSRLEFDCCIDPEWPSSDVSLMEDSFGPESFSDPPLLPRNRHPLQHLASFGSSGVPLVSMSNSPILHGVSGISGGLLARKDDNERPRSTPNEMQRDHIAPPSQASTFNANTEDTLFMHYLDQVFYIQYPFYHFQNRQGRGWVLAILRRAGSAYHAALALSERHLLPMPLGKGDISTSLIQLRTQNGHYDLAIQELQRMIRDSCTSTGLVDVKPSLEILMTLLQIFFFEIFTGGREKWHAHLRTACKFIPPLLQERMATTSSNSSDSDCSTEQSQKATFCPEVDSALKFLLGSFISFDIIASASTRSAPFLPINHVQVLDNIGISLEPLIGFQNSVMALILEIVSLEKWKNEARRVSKLSIADLAKRSDGIQDRLRKELAATEQASSGQALYNSPGTPTQAPTYPDISKIYILAAMTYLHVVVSGPYPAVPEIANSVTETIVAFKSLKDVSLLRYVVWPLCISGCLALEDHYDFFRDLVFRAGVTPWTPGTCFEAFCIMQECWKARVTSDESCDWATTMKTRGCYVYLG